MRDLIAVGFPGTHRAVEVLRQMQSLDARGAIDLADDTLGAPTRPR